MCCFQFVIVVSNLCTASAKLLLCNTWLAALAQQRSLKRKVTHQQFTCACVCVCFAKLVFLSPLRRLPL